MLRTALIFISILLILSEKPLFANTPCEVFEPARQLFDETAYHGTILIYDESNDSLFASHPERIDERFIPASTFKIISSQAALETGVIKNRHVIIPWDGVTRGRKETNKDLDLTQAFRISAVPHFQSLVREIGPERMQVTLDSIPYGNCDISGGIDQFWLTGGLRISPAEQITILRRLFNDELPFSKETMKSAREMMALPSTGQTSYWAKTGWAILPENRNIGWWVGWANRNGRILFFATVLDSSDPGPTFGTDRIELTKKALEILFEQGN